jgi:hypothetical protein
MPWIRSSRGTGDIARCGVPFRVNGLHDVRIAQALDQALR